MSRDRLLHYYDRELRFIRSMAVEFAKKYPDVAGRLMLEPTKCDDPHVERMIEAFAVLAARVQLRLDDDFSEVSEALLGILYPHYLAPIPSMAIVQFEVDPESGAVAGGVCVDRHTVLRSQPVERVRCKFRTAYPLKLWPLEVARIEIIPSNRLQVANLPAGVRSAVEIVVRTPEGVSLADLEIDALRFFVPSEGGSVHPLYQLLLANPRGLVVRGDRPRLLGPEHVRSVGFERDDGLLAYPTESLLAYRLLQEYFAFPEKFLFVELTGLADVTHDEEARDFSLSVLLDDPIGTHDFPLRPENLRLGCVPAVNLFPHVADPIRLSRVQSEYEVVPDVRSQAAYEVHSIKRVTAPRPGSNEVRTYHPFYALQHGEVRSDDAAYWTSMRRPSLRKDQAGTDVFLTLVDPDFDFFSPDVDTLSVETLCTNRDLPSRLDFARAQGDFSVEGPSEIRSVRCVRNPTVAVSSPISAGSRWRIVSHLALHHLSLTGDTEAGLGDWTADGGSLHDPDEATAPAARGLEALREMLKLYDFADSPVTRNRINGLVGLEAKRVVRRVGRGALSGFVRGIEVKLELDPHQYTGAGAFLFASVLERFLSLYASVNSFTQTAATLRGREGVLKRWPPRIGRAHVL